MENTAFLKRVLAGGRQYCLLGLHPSRPKIQKFFSTVEKVVHAAENADANGFDTYFGLATFDDVGERKAANALQMCSLFLDLDCGEGKEYPEQGEAIAALRAFCKTVGMPRPIMVSSGYVCTCTGLCPRRCRSPTGSPWQSLSSAPARPMACTATPA